MPDSQTPKKRKTTQGREVPRHLAVYLTEADYAALGAVSGTRGTSRSDLARQIILSWLCSEQQ